MTVPDHPHADPGDGRSECAACGKWVWLVTHSCKRVPVTEAALARAFAGPNLTGVQRSYLVVTNGTPCELREPD